MNRLIQTITANNLSSSVNWYKMMNSASKSSNFLYITNRLMNSTRICNFSYIKTPKQSFGIQKQMYSTSALYITGEAAKNTYSIVKPHLDLDERLEEGEKLSENLKYRGYTTQIQSLQETYEILKAMQNELSVMEVTRQEVSKRLNNLLKNPEKNAEDIERLKTPANICKREYKDLKDQFTGIEEAIALKILDLPNVLHEKTPLKESEIVYEHLNAPKSSNDSLSNLEIASNHDLIEYIDPTFVILKNDAAMFEYNVVNHFRKVLSEVAGYTAFSNADFARSVVLEGCGCDFKSVFNTFTLDYVHHDVKNELVRDHLVGGASLYSFMSYFTRHFIQDGYLPLKLFASGRKYNPVERNTACLFNTVQSSDVRIFSAVKDDPVAENDLIESLQCLLIELYKPFNVHFRIVNLSCNKLEKAESFKLSLQMYSLHCHKYVEVASVASYEKFLSKRLFFTYSDNKQQRFLRVVSGSVLNVQKLLGCLIENNAACNKKLVPDIG